MRRGIDDAGRERQLIADLFGERALRPAYLFQGEPHVAQALRILRRERLVRLGGEIRQGGRGQPS